MKANYLLSSIVLGLVCVAGADAATAKKQSAIQNTTTVRTRVAATGIYDQNCYDEYYGCMDQFCILDNMDGGSCACSDESAQYEKRLADVKDTLTEAERIQTEEVERVQAGADADIIFNGTRQYDARGNILDSTELSDADKKAQRRANLLAMFDTSFDDDDVFEDSDYDDISNKTGNALFAAAHNMCVEHMDESCAKDFSFLKSIYSRQITSDCKALANSVTKQEAEAKRALADAQSAVRGALRESLAAANKYDRGQCMVEYKKCMQTADACGTNWENCVFTIASENMQNQKAVSVAGKKVDTISRYDITTSTMEVLESKRYICERVLDSCVAVRDMVWDDFLREAAPTIRLAESQAESKKRQSCLSDISKCIQTACKDDIAGKGVATMDACLARPDMARSFCKVEIDPCERMEPQIWSYVTDKLAAMRVDACTQEVKDCFTDETRCGTDFSQCIGMDYDYIKQMCPVDKLVVCKKANPAFSMDDLDSMLFGLYLNVDNAMLDNCQDLIERRMTEICGSTTDCNRFAADDTMGAGSLRSQKTGPDGTTYRVTGMISFGSIKIGDAVGSISDADHKLLPGEIGVSEYIAKVREVNDGKQDAENIISIIEEELNNIAGTINRTIELIEQDPEIQYCVNGRDLSQITGKKGQTTTARFPNLLNSIKMQIALSALRKAQDNYNDKFTEMVAQATKDASADIAQYMCQMMPMNNGGVASIDNVKTELVPPYSISYDVGSGLSNDMLAQGGHNQSATGTKGGMQTTANQHTKTGDVIGSVLTLGWNQMIANNNVSIETPSGTREMWSIFNRDTRVCHYCTSTITKNCNTIHKNVFLGTVSQKDEQNCTESDPVERCEDIQM